MRKVERFDFRPVPTNWGANFPMPLLPLKLTAHNREVEILGLVDTGSAVNVLPHSMGLALGEIWKPEKATLKLTGNLAAFPAAPLIVMARVGQFAPVEMIFAWTQNDAIRPILGHVNFLDEFDVCLYRSRRIVEVRLKP